MMSTLRIKSRVPSHPGVLLRDVVLPELGITQSEFADRLGVSRRTDTARTPPDHAGYGNPLGQVAGQWRRDLAEDAASGLLALIEI